jgi:hypothetical protein
MGERAVKRYLQWLRIVSLLSVSSITLYTAENMSEPPEEG